jgi:hypothetical protein
VTTLYRLLFVFTICKDCLPFSTLCDLKMLSNIKYFSRLTDAIKKPCLVYGGDKAFEQQGILVTSWRDLTRVE